MFSIILFFNFDLGLQLDNNILVFLNKALAYYLSFISIFGP